ncbi:hypothetical protein AB0E12_17270 [Micromonospora chersina]|uniref:hypothetical protein n=1 Tax=Micromonospora chersina TaxID=47854 RepID=UPI0033D47CE7
MREVVRTPRAPRFVVNSAQIAERLDVFMVVEERCGSRVFAYVGDSIDAPHFRRPAA